VNPHHNVLGFFFCSRPSRIVHLVSVPPFLNGGDVYFLGCLLVVGVFPPRGVLKKTGFHFPENFLTSLGLPPGVFFFWGKLVLTPPFFELFSCPFFGLPPKKKNPLSFQENTHPLGVGGGTLIGGGFWQGGWGVLGLCRGSIFLVKFIYTRFGPPLFFLHNPATGQKPSFKKPPTLSKKKLEKNAQFFTPFPRGGVGGDLIFFSFLPFFFGP